MRKTDSAGVSGEGRRSPAQTQAEAQDYREAHRRENRELRFEVGLQRISGKSSVRSFSMPDRMLEVRLNSASPEFRAAPRSLPARRAQVRPERSERSSFLREREYGDNRRRI